MNGTNTKIVETAITSDWTRANIKKLLAKMTSCIPERDRMRAYTKGLKAVNWENVAFPPFSPEACQEKWGEILQMMRKTRTLTELIFEAEDIFSGPVSNKKARYAKKRQLAVEEYDRGMLESGKQSSKRKYRPYQRRKKVSADGEQCTEEKDGLPSKPPFNGYNLFCKEQLASMAGVPKNAYVSVWAQRWRDLSERQREEYSSRCRELKNQYTVKMNEYLQTLDKEEQKRFLKKLGNKRSQYAEEDVMFPGEPKMPSRSGNVIFCKDQMELLKDKFPNSRKRFSEVSQMWKDLSGKERKRYKEKVNKNFEKYLEELQKWFKTLTPAAQKTYRQCNVSKCQYLDNGLKFHDSEESSCRPSDSEDEDIEDSSSDEEEDNKDCEEDDEEEEEGDNMFQMY